MERIITVGQLKKVLEGLKDDDQVCLETTDLDTGSAQDLYPFYIDVIDGIKLTDGSEISEVRFCQLNNI